MEMKENIADILYRFARRTVLRAFEYRKLGKTQKIQFVQWAIYKNREIGLNRQDAWKIAEYIGDNWEAIPGEIFFNDITEMALNAYDELFPR